MRCKKHTNWQNKLSNVQDDLLRRQAAGQDITAEAEALRLQTDEYFQSLEACQECDPLLLKQWERKAKERR